MYLMLFASAMGGAVRGNDPQTGRYFDDTERYEDVPELNDETQKKVFELNARRLCPWLDEHPEAQGR